MTEKEYNIAVGKILAGKSLTDEDANNFVEILTKFEGLLNQGDYDDCFSTQGWRHIMGWD